MLLPDARTVLQASTVDTGLGITVSEVGVWVEQTVPWPPEDDMKLVAPESHSPRNMRMRVSKAHSSTDNDTGKNLSLSH
jgi:hypothetical protein